MQTLNLLILTAPFFILPLIFFFLKPFFKDETKLEVSKNYIQQQLQLGKKKATICVVHLKSSSCWICQKNGPNPKKIFSRYHKEYKTLDGISIIHALTKEEHSAKEPK